MKKVITVLVIVGLVILMGILEIVATNNVYKDLKDSLLVVELSMEEHPKNYDNADTISKMDRVMAIWERNRNYIFTVNNHLNMRSLDEKLVSLKTQIEVNADQDAMVNLNATKNYITDLMQDNLPNLKNLL